MTRVEPDATDDCDHPASPGQGDAERTDGETPSPSIDSWSGPGKHDHGREPATRDKLPSSGNSQPDAATACPLTAALMRTKIHIVREVLGTPSTAHLNRTREVRCPRVTQAAMIAAASFGLRRSGKHANGSVGSGLSGRISEAWPTLAPPGECFAVCIFPI
jgi:hypothetical protein